MAREALIRLMDNLKASIDGILAQEHDYAQQLRAIVMQLCQTFARARPPFYRDLETTPALTEIVEAGRARCFLQVEGVIRAGMATGRFRAGLDPRVVRRALLGAVEATTQPTILAEERMSLTQAFDAILDVVLHGMFEGQTAHEGGAGGAAEIEAKDMT